ALAGRRVAASRQVNRLAAVRAGHLLGLPATVVVTEVTVSPIIDVGGLARARTCIIRSSVTSVTSRRIPRVLRMGQTDAQEPEAGPPLLALEAALVEQLAERPCRAGLLAALGAPGCPIGVQSLQRGP